MTTGEKIALLLTIAIVSVAVIEYIVTVDEQGNRDARRLDVIEQKLGIPGPDEATPTIKDLLATIEAMK